MAVITRFYSDAYRRGTPGTLDSRINPNMAGAPAEAAAQAIGQQQDQLMGQAQVSRQEAAVQYQNAALQNEAIQKAVLIQQDAAQKAARVNYTQSQLDLQLKAQELQNDYNKDGRPHDQKIPEYKKRWATDVQAQAQMVPDAQLQQQLLSHGGIAGARMFGKFEGEAVAANQAGMLLQYESRVNQYANSLQRDPTQLTAVQAQFAQYAGELQNYGFDEKTMQKMVFKANDKLEKSAFLGAAQTNPEQVKAMISQGLLDDKDPSYVNHLNNMIKVSENGVKKQISSEMKLLQDIMIQGKDLPQGAEQILMSATAHGLTDQVATLDRTRQMKEHLLGVPIAEQVNTFNQFLANERANPTMGTKDLQFMSKAIGNQLKLAQKDPMLYAAQTGVIQLDGSLPLDNTNPNFPSAVEARKGILSRTEVLTGHAVSPLTALEAKTLGDTMAKGSVEDQLKAISALSVFGEERAKLAAEQLKGHNPIIGIAADIYGDNDQLAEEILRGRQQLVNKNIQAPSSKVRTEASTTLFGDLYADRPDEMANIQAAANAYYADKMAGGHEIDYKDALKKVSGAVTLNKGWFDGAAYKTIAPRVGMSDTAVQDLVNGLDASKVTMYGTTDGGPRYADGTPVRDDDLQTYQLVPVSKGQYMFRKGQSLLMDDTLQQPFVFNFKQLADDES